MAIKTRRVVRVAFDITVDETSKDVTEVTPIVENMLKAGGDEVLAFEYLGFRRIMERD